jgi:hypothetical protein
MLVWHELKSQKETLDALTRHVEALVLEAPTPADAGHHHHSSPSGRRQRSPSQQRHAEAVDHQYHNVVDRLESLSAFQRNLLLRPLPEHHPGLIPATQSTSKAPAPHTSNGGQSVQRRVDELVRAAAPERKQLSAPSRLKTKAAVRDYL